MKVVTARSAKGAYFAGATWRELPPTGQPATHLTMDVTSETPAGQQEALAIFRSVELSRQ